MEKTKDSIKRMLNEQWRKACNGIIIRNPDCKDEVTLAITSEARGIYGERDLTNEYKAIGRKIYSWLMDVVIQEYKDDMIITNFDIDVTATCKGRPFNE